MRACGDARDAARGVADEPHAAPSGEGNARDGSPGPGPIQIRKIDLHRALPIGRQAKRKSESFYASTPLPK